MDDYLSLACQHKIVTNDNSYIMANKTDKKIQIGLHMSQSESFVN